METGGMKGRRREMIRAEVHDLLKQRWQLDVVHSEYGMTELLSQAYAPADGRFICPPWMRVMLRSEDDPLERTGPLPGKIQTGLVDIIDLANKNSCSFISTDDIGRLTRTGVLRSSDAWITATCEAAASLRSDSFPSVCFLCPRISLS